MTASTFRDQSQLQTAVLPKQLQKESDEGKADFAGARNIELLSFKARSIIPQLFDELVKEKMHPEYKKRQKLKPRIPNNLPEEPKFTNYC